MVSGVHPALPNQSVPFWENSANVIAEDLAIRPSPGQLTLFTRQTGEAVTGVLAVDADGTAALTWGTTTGLYDGDATTAPAGTDRSRTVGGPYTGTVNDLWSIIQFGGAELATNGVDEVQYRPNRSTSFENISGLSDLPGTFRAQILMKTGAFVIAINTDNVDSEVRWCTEDDPTVWVPAANNSARDIQVRQFNSGIQGAVDLGRNIILVGRNQLFSLRFVGAPFWFSAELLMDGAGAVGKHAVVEHGRSLYGFGADGIWATDGSQIRFIDRPSIHDYIYHESQFDPTDLDRVVGWVDNDHAMIFFSGPSVDGQGFTVAYEPRRNIWHPQSFWRTAASDGGLWDNPVTGDPSGTVWRQGVSDIPLSAELVRLQFQDSISFDSGFSHLGFGAPAFGGVWTGTDGFE